MWWMGPCIYWHIFSSIFTASSRESSVVDPQGTRESTARDQEESSRCTGVLVECRQENGILDQEESSKENAGHGKENAGHRKEQLLGINPDKCAFCESAPLLNRVFIHPTRNRHAAYCEECWWKWEKCCQWKPTARIRSRPPRNDWMPQDIFFCSEFVCKEEDLAMFNALIKVDGEEWHGGRHLAGDANHPIVREIIEKMERGFQVKANKTRLNLYRSGDCKPMHCDASGWKEVTIGVGLGGSRDIVLTHIESGTTWSFELRNGDVFAFTPEVNAKFMHGIQKGDSERVSVILWGYRVLEDAQ